MTDIIANILLREIGSTPKVQPVTPSTGLGAMTSRKGITAPQEEQQADPTQNIQRPIIDIYRKIVQQEIGDGSGLTGEKIPYDPLVDTPETLAARGYNPDEVLRNSVFSSTISGTKGRTPKDKVLTDIEDLIQSYEDKRLAKKRSVSKERATASSSILDVLEAELMRGMTSKQTDTQPTVSADSSRDRFELQGDMRDLPVLDDEDTPEVDTRSNELLDKPLSSDGLGSRPALTDDDMGLPDDDNYMGYLPDTPEQKLLDRIALGEGADPEKLKAQEKYNIGTTEYDMVYSYGSELAPSKPVTDMTLNELYTYQTNLIDATKGKVPGTKLGTSAVGKYQVLKSSLFGKGTPDKPSKNSWADKLNLTGDTVYTPVIQEAIGRLALKEAGYDNWLKGNKSESSMLQRISDIWASVEGSKANQGTHTTKEDLEPFLALVRPEIKYSELAPKTSLRPKARPDTRIASN